MLTNIKITSKELRTLMLLNSVILNDVIEVEFEDGDGTETEIEICLNLVQDEEKNK